MSACVSRRELIRDRTAYAVLKIARLFGAIVYWKNPGKDPIPVYGIVVEGSEELGILGGQTAIERFVMIVPRQGDPCHGFSVSFPPAEGFMVKAVVFRNDVPFAVSVSYDAELPEYAPVFVLECRRFKPDGGGTVELDGIESP